MSLFFGVTRNSERGIEKEKELDRNLEGQRSRSIDLSSLDYVRLVDSTGLEPHK